MRSLQSFVTHEGLAYTFYATLVLSIMTTCICTAESGGCVLLLLRMRPLLSQICQPAAEHLHVCKYAYLLYFYAHTDMLLPA